MNISVLLAVMIVVIHTYCIQRIGNICLVIDGVFGVELICKIRREMDITISVRRLLWKSIIYLNVVISVPICLAIVIGSTNTYPTTHQLHFISFIYFAGETHIPTGRMHHHIHSQQSIQVLVVWL